MFNINLFLLILAKFNVKEKVEFFMLDFCLKLSEKLTLFKWLWEYFIENKISEISYIHFHRVSITITVVKTQIFGYLSSGSGHAHLFPLYFKTFITTVTIKSPTRKSPKILATLQAFIFRLFRFPRAHVRRQTYRDAEAWPL